jgi:hypothetical protein
VLGFIFEATPPRCTAGPVGFGSSPFVSQGRGDHPSDRAQFKINAQQHRPPSGEQALAFL